MTDREAQEWARGVWQRIGRDGGFPRSLETAIGWALPLAIVKLPRLTLERLRTWLSDRHVSFRCETSDRRFRAALIARAGHGLIFLEGSDSADEQRLSIAHEVVHFVRHYLAPRERALELLGNGALEILDGRRPPTLEERLLGLLSHVELGTLTHLMDRTDAGDVQGGGVLALEDEADRLALEILAPRAAVTRKLEKYGISRRSVEAVPKVAEVLGSEFGLPVAAAAGYARYLVGRERPHRSFREWLGA